MEHSLKDTIKEFLKTYKLEEKINQVHVQEIWERLMGKTISDHTTKIYIVKKTLHLKFDSAALRQEMSYAKEKVIDMINKEMGEKVIEEIILS